MPWQKPGPGRPRGTGGIRTKSSMEKSAEAKSMTDQIINDPAYRKSLLERAIAGTLPPQVETMLFYYSFGKPVENIEIKDTTLPADLENMSEAELEVRAQRLTLAIKELRTEKEREQREAVKKQTEQDIVDGEVVGPPQLPENTPIH